MTSCQTLYHHPSPNPHGSSQSPHMAPNTPQKHLIRHTLPSTGSRSLTTARFAECSAQVQQAPQWPPCPIKAVLSLCNRQRPTSQDSASIQPSFRPSLLPSYPLLESAWRIPTTGDPAQPQLSQQQLQIDEVLMSTKQDELTPAGLPSHPSIPLSISVNLDPESRDSRPDAGILKLNGNLNPLISL